MKSKIALVMYFAAAAGTAHAEVNPFTGVKVETEQVKGQIELQREKNSLSKEQIEARRLEFQAKNVDKVMEAELRKMLNPPGSGGAGNFNQDPLMQALAKKPAPPKVEPPKVDPMVDMPFMPRGMEMGGPKSMPVSQAPKLVMVLDNGHTKQAVVEHLGQAHTVRVGDSTPLGTVSSIDRDAIMIGGKKMTLDKTVVAINNPDAQDPGSMGGGKVQGGQPAILPGMPPGARPGVVR